jgi:hypothetical protein
MSSWSREREREREEKKNFRHLLFKAPLSNTFPSVPAGICNVEKGKVFCSLELSV